MSNARVVFPVPGAPCMSRTFPGTSRNSKNMFIIGDDVARTTEDSRARGSGFVPEAIKLFRHGLKGNVKDFKNLSPLQCSGGNQCDGYVTLTLHTSAIRHKKPASFQTKNWNAQAKEEFDRQKWKIKERKSQ